MMCVVVILGIKISSSVASTYMPWYNNTDDHLIEYISMLTGCLQSVTDRHAGSLFLLDGDFI